MAFTNKDFDVTNKDHKRIVINPGVPLDTAKKALETYISDCWETASKILGEVFEEHVSMVSPGLYHELGANYMVDDIMIFVYPTKTSFVVTRKENFGFKKID